MTLKANLVFTVYLAYLYVLHYIQKRMAQSYRPFLAAQLPMCYWKRPHKDTKFGPLLGHCSHSYKVVADLHPHCFWAWTELRLAAGGQERRVEVVQGRERVDLSSNNLRQVLSSCSQSVLPLSSHQLHSWQGLGRLIGGRKPLSRDK